MNAIEIPQVKTIAVSQPNIGETRCNFAEDLIAYCARVSNPTNQHNTETAPKLVRYLARNGHWSPFEMVSLTLEIITTRDIARQILRHRSFSFQEFSQRYAVAQDFVTREARLQDAKNRQNSHPVFDATLEAWWKAAQDKLLEDVQSLYNSAIKHGIAKEVARAVLPEGLTVSRMYMAGTVRSWIHYVQTRCRPDTQKEHRQVAELCKAELLRHFPSLAELLEGGA